MAELRSVSGGKSVLLEPELLVGRSPGCGLCLVKSYVSSKHALIRWNGSRWELRDLASRNGTFVEAVRVTAGVPVPLQKGQTVCFGDVNEHWRVADDAPPQVAVIRVEGGARIPLKGTLLALPAPGKPHVTIYRAADGRWLLERPRLAVRELTNGDVFEVDGAAHRFSCPTMLPPTSVAAPAQEAQTVALAFRVSSDEEHVQIEVTIAGQVVPLRPRNHDYLLLLLARRRLEDARDGHPEGECGWMYQDDLEDALHVTQSRFNLDVYRIRREFEGLPIRNGASVIERRSRVKQLRIGASRLALTRF